MPAHLPGTYPLPLPQLEQILAAMYLHVILCGKSAQVYRNVVQMFHPVVPISVARLPLSNMKVFTCFVMSVRDMEFVFMLSAAAMQPTRQSSDQPINQLQISQSNEFLMVTRVVFDCRGGHS